MFEVIGSGMSLPKRKIENEYFYNKFGRETLEIAFDRLGHGARYYCESDECAASLGIGAGKQAIANAKIDPSEIDLIVVSTDTPSQPSPGTAFEIQYKLGAKNAAAFDINCSCAGFVTAMDIGLKYLNGKEYKTVMVIGTYAMSRFLDPDDGAVSVLFGDGAGALIIRYKDNGNKWASTLIANGEFWDYMGVYGGGSKKPITSEMLTKTKEHCVKIPKKFPATLNVDYWPSLVTKTLDKLNLTPSDVNHYVFTQIRKTTIVDVMKILNQPMEHTTTIMEKWGYTGSGCIPMAFHDAVTNKRIKKGDRVVLCASGGGFAMAVVTFVY